MNIFSSFSEFSSQFSSFLFRLFRRSTALSERPNSLVHCRFDFHPLNINIRVVSCSQFFFLSGSGRAEKNVDENLWAPKCLNSSLFARRGMWVWRVSSGEKKVFDSFLWWCFKRLFCGTSVCRGVLIGTTREKVCKWKKMFVGKSNNCSLQTRLM